MKMIRVFDSKDKKYINIDTIKSIQINTTYASGLWISCNTNDTEYRLSKTYSDEEYNKAEQELDIIIKSINKEK